ncbi:MAG: ELM1/GtrOC1 family putative glycosyltransferase [Candidatus Paracaedibacteraceae bacterium]|nr:ELM1/GtrOC1 family putative glycosyltransferase [Candidatus Paracaedibacteraceae bacterium]
MHNKIFTKQKKIILILCDKGKIGTLRQCEALAKPLANHFDAELIYIDVNLPFWFKVLTPRLTRHWPIALLPTNIKKQPSLIIAAGRQAFLLASPVAKHIPTIALLNPRCPLNYFKVIIPPQHDGIGEHTNVIETLGSLHPHNSASFTTKPFKDHNIITVLLGGNSKHYTFQEKDFIEISTYLKEKAASKSHTKILISPSRRTPMFGVDILRRELAHIDSTIWDNTGENPYFSYIGAANEILVTSDSISMISEACYLGKPVEIWQLPICNKRFDRFYKAIIKAQHAVFARKKWPEKFKPLKELDRILPILIKKI